jgi:hypothetical protein
MNSDRRANLQRKLTLTPVPKPPAGLADKIKGEIPKHLLIDTEQERRRLSQSVAFSMRVAASILVLVSSLYVGLQLMSRKSAEQTPMPAATREMRRTEPTTDTLAVASPESPAVERKPALAKVARANTKKKQEGVLADRNRDTAPAPSPTALAAPAQPPPPAAAEERVAPLAAKSANVVAQEGGTSRLEMSFDRIDRSTTTLVQQFAAPAALPMHGVQLDVEASSAPFDVASQVLRVSIDAADAASDALLNVNFDSASVVGHRAIVSIHSALIGKNSSRTLLYRFELTSNGRPDAAVVAVRLRYRTSEGTEETLETTLRRLDLRAWSGASARMKGAALAAALGEALRTGGDRSAIAAEARRVGLGELAALSENPQR